MKKFATLVAIPLVFLMSSSALACPGCAASVSSQAGTSAEVIWGYSFCMSIYFMLAVVHALIFYAFYRMYKLINAEEQRHAKV